MTKKILELQFSQKYGYFGSKEHFFHYYWGYVLPGMHLAISTTERNPGDYSFILDDCGPVMNQVALEMFSLISKDITFQNDSEFSKDCIQVPRWDILINFDSVLFEDEHSFRGSTTVYRENEFLKSVVNEPGFPQQLQNEMRELRSWVLDRVVGPGAGDVGKLKRRVPKTAPTDVLTNLPVVLRGGAASRTFRRGIQKFLNLNGPRPLSYIQGAVTAILEKYRDYRYGQEWRDAIANGPPQKKKKSVRKARVLLLCRSPEPEYYSENGGAKAKKYGASRRTLTEIDEAYDFFKARGHKIELYEPGGDTLFKQIKKFYASGAVIGIKGAELSNTFWMKPGSKVIEITPNVMRSTPVYERFGRFLGLKSIDILAIDGATPSVLRLRREINDHLKN